MMYPLPHRVPQLELYRLGKIQMGSEPPSQRVTAVQQ